MGAAPYAAWLSDEAPHDTVSKRYRVAAGSAQVLYDSP